MNLNFKSPLIFPFAAPAILLAAMTAGAHASVIAQYTFGSGTVSGDGTANPTATSVASTNPGVTASDFTVVGGVSGRANISTATSTAYLRGDLTPAIDSIYSASRYFTFSTTFTSAYNLQSLSFEFGGNPASATLVTYAFAAQIQIGATGEWQDLGSVTAAAASGTGTWIKTGDYFAPLTAAEYQNLKDTTVSVRIFIADDTNTVVNGRITNVIFNAEAVPEPSSLVLLGAGLLGCFSRRRR